MSEYERYEEKPVITRLNHLLPELIERNNKQGKTLKDKIRVNLFFEKREKKAWKNVMNIIDLSQNRRNSVKNGNYLKKILSRSTNEIEKMSDKILENKLYSHILEFNREKKLLKENAGVENLKRVKKILTTIRKKHFSKKKNIEEKKKIRALSNQELSSAKAILNSKFVSDKKKLDNSLKIYKNQLNYMKNTMIPNKKLHYNYSIPNLNMLSYSKYIEPEFKEDKESTSITKINKYIIKRNEIYYPKKNTIRKSSSSEQLMKYHSIYPDNTFGIFPLTKEDYCDTVQLLNKEVLNNFFLSMKLENNSDKIDNLINKKLPQLKDFEEIYLNKITSQHKKKNMKDEEIKEINNEENKKKKFFEFPLIIEFKNFIQSQPKKYRKISEYENYNDDELKEKNNNDFQIRLNNYKKNPIKNNKSTLQSESTLNKSKISSSIKDDCRSEYNRLYNYGYKKTLPYTFLNKSQKTILNTYNKE